MSFSPFDNLPLLTKKEALEILKRPKEELNLSSDYYKAVFHLAKYPSVETENALLNLIQSEDSSLAVAIARRKAVEVLARIGCKKAIPIIKELLNSEDTYLVENVAWALQELGCDDINVQKDIGLLLEDPKQHLRVLIQTLSKMNAISQVSKIKKVLVNFTNSPSIRGAAIAAISNLSGSKDNIYELSQNLRLTNQNDRQSAVQDIIDANALSLLPEVIRAPISPYFRIRAIENLWPESCQICNKLSLHYLLQTVLLDCPSSINLLHINNNNLSLGSLVEKLFSTDFNQCYFSLMKLKQKSFYEIWPSLSVAWESFEKDYGALYFLIQLLRGLDGLDSKAKEIFSELLFSCLSDRWPVYMKFRPVAIISLIQLDLRSCLSYVPKWLDEKNEKNWMCRYSVLFCLDNLYKKSKDKSYLLPIHSSINDSHRFVRLKAQEILS